MRILERIEKDNRRWEDLSCSWISWANIVKSSKRFLKMVFYSPFFLLQMLMATHHFFILFSFTVYWIATPPLKDFFCTVTWTVYSIVGWFVGLLVCLKNP